MIDINIYKEIISNQNNQHCSICLCNYKDNDIKKTLSCEHVFHQSCISKLLESSEACPICKFNVKDEEIENIKIIENNNIIDEGLKQNCFRKCLSELISILIHISDNYLLENNDINYFQKIQYF